MPTDSNSPDICNDNNVLAVSLVTVKVRKADFNAQVIKGIVFHFSSLKVCVASFTRFCPLNNCAEIRATGGFTKLAQLLTKLKVGLVDAFLCSLFLSEEGHKFLFVKKNKPTEQNSPNPLAYLHKWCDSWRQVA